jgi:hypothetical protein
MRSALASAVFSPRRRTPSSASSQRRRWRGRAVLRRHLGGASPGSNRCDRGTQDCPGARANSPSGVLPAATYPRRQTQAEGTQWGSPKPPPGSLQRTHGSMGDQHSPSHFCIRIRRIRAVSYRSPVSNAVRAVAAKGKAERPRGADVTLASRGVGLRPARHKGFGVSYFRGLCGHRSSILPVNAYLPGQLGTVPPAAGKPLRCRNC